MEIDSSRLFLHARELLAADDVDVGTSDAEPFLGVGWSETRTWTDGSSVAAIAGPRARLRLQFGEAVDRQIVLRRAAAATRRCTLGRALGSPR